MANNVDVKDATGATVTIKSTDNAGVHTYHRNIDSSALPTGAATEAKQDTQITAEQAILAKLLTAPATEAKQDTQVTAIGGLTETAPATDTASSGLNGRLQRIAQRITTLLAVFPTTIDTNSGNKSASTLRVVLATDQPAMTTAQPVAQLSRAAAAANVHLPTSNTAAVVTFAAAGGGIANVIGGVAWSYNLTPTAGNLKIEDVSGTTVFSIDITTAGPGFIPFNPPLKGDTNAALIITLAAGGSGVTGKVNALSAWVE